MQKPKILLLLTIITFGMVFVFNPMSAPTQEVKAWSGDTHGWLSKTAIRLMPAPWNETLQTELQFFLDNSNLPDRVRSSLETADPAGYDAEAPRHYCDADVRPEIYGNSTHHPQPEFSRTYNSKDPRESSDYQLGVVMWAVENWTIKLTEDLQQYDWDSDEVLEDMVMLAHYIQDSYMPFHGVSFYDGQRVPAAGEPDSGMFYTGGQEGIHGILENTFVQLRYPTEINAILDNVSGQAEYVNPYMASLNGALSCEAVARELLNYKDVQGYQYMSTEWYEAIWAGSGGPDGNYTIRLIDSSIQTANVWFTAFVDAGILVDPNAPTTTTTTEPEITTTTTTTTTTEETTGLTSAEIIVLLSLSTISLVVTRRKRK